MRTCDSGEGQTINCPRCHRPNPVELIYCAVLDCAAMLHPGRTACDACRATIPVNACFCPDCGQATRYLEKRKSSTPRESGQVGGIG